MSWRDQLRPGSFRGARFAIRNADTEGGRRGELHEFPDRDDPWFEDLGRSARRWSIEAIVVGPDYMVDRDALIAACETKGPGTLVHPFLGTMPAVCLTFRLTETTEQGGMAVFTIDFAEPGVIIPAEARADTPALATAEADAVVDQAPQRFADGFSTASMPAFVEDAGVDLVRTIAATATTASLALGGSGPSLRTFEAGLLALPGGAIALVRAPISLGHAIVGLIGSLAALGSSPVPRINALRAMMVGATMLPPVAGTTPVRNRQRDNQDAFVRLVLTVAAAEAVRTCATARFVSYDDAIALRDGLADELDSYAVRSADAGDDDAADALDRLRLIMVRDVTARGGSLARLYGYVPAITEPALAIAHRLHGDLSIVVDRAEELVERNRVRHPGFVTGGQRLEIRSDV